MRNREAKKRTSSYDRNRQCYLSKDGTAYYYEWLNPISGRYEKVQLAVSKDGLTEEIILFLDRMDHEEDLGNRYEYENRDPEFESLIKNKESDSDGKNRTDPWNLISHPGADPAEILFGREEKENRDIDRVRRVIDTKCNERQQNLFFAHFGEGRQLEQIRKGEVAATGKEKGLQAIVNVKNDIIRKVADEYGVVPVKRRRHKKKD